MPNKPKKVQELTPRDNPALSTEDANQDSEASPNSLEITSSEGGESVPTSANTTGEIGDVQITNVPSTDERPSTSRQANEQFFFRDQAPLESPTDFPESQSNSSLLGSSTAGLCLPSIPPADERRPPDTLAVPPSDLNVPAITISKDMTVNLPPPASQVSTKPKSKGGLGYALNKLMDRLSPGKEKPPSDKAVGPDSSVNADSSTSKLDKPKKRSPLRNWLKERSPKSSPDKKSKSSKLKALSKAVHPKNLFHPRCADEESDHLVEFDESPKTENVVEKPKRAKDHWEAVKIPKDFKCVPSVDLSETTIDSQSTDCTIPESPMSDILNSNRAEEEIDQDSDIQPPSEFNPDLDMETDPEKETEE